MREPPPFPLCCTTVLCVVVDSAVLGAGRAPVGVVKSGSLSMTSSNCSVRVPSRTGDVLHVSSAMLWTGTYGPSAVLLRIALRGGCSISQLLLDGELAGSLPRFSLSLDDRRGGDVGVGGRGTGGGET